MSELWNVFSGWELVVALTFATSTLVLAWRVLMPLDEPGPHRIMTWLLLAMLALLFLTLPEALGLFIGLGLFWAFFTSHALKVLLAEGLRRARLVALRLLFMELGLAALCAATLALEGRWPLLALALGGYCWLGFLFAIDRATWTGGEGLVEHLVVVKVLLVDEVGPAVASAYVLLLSLYVAITVPWLEFLFVLGGVGGLGYALWTLQE